jgi:hypothetical protein
LKLLVTGGREFGRHPAEREFIYKMIEETLGDLAIPHVIIQGGAPGADEIAVEWAKLFGVAFETYAVTKEDWCMYGRAAGPIRNSKMLKESKPDKVLAFPGNRGTADMTRKAVLADVPVIYARFIKEN